MKHAKHLVPKSLVSVAEIYYWKFAWLANNAVDHTLLDAHQCFVPGRGTPIEKPVGINAVATRAVRLPLMPLQQHASAIQQNPLLPQK